MRFVLGLLLVIVFADGAAGATCETLASLSLPDAKITTAQAVAAGEFTPYPQLAPHTGSGSIDEAENFVCR